ncbi:MAG: hypothetical protein ACRDMZ_07660 [Solirubrobacteraceae bacterium]
MPLAACGDSSPDSGGAPAADPAASHAAADKLIAQAVAANPKARSARIDGTIDVVVKGVPRFEGAIQLSANGAYDLPDGKDVPDLDIDVGLSLDGQALGGAIVVAGGTGYVKLGNAGYKLPARISKALVELAPAAKNGLTKTAAMFYINPQDWQTNAQLLGDADVAGESTQHIKADIRPGRFFLDMSRLVRFLTMIRVTQALGLPEDLGPKLRAALERSVTVAGGEVWIGTDDHVLRRAHAVGRLEVAAKDRKTLLGMTSATLDATVNISEVGDDHAISAPKQLDSYSSLQLSLDALGEAARRRGK